VREACAAVAAESGEVVEPANFNDPKQTVIAGSKAGVDRACEKLKSMGAKRALLLPVSAPFHSSLMKPAADALRERLAGVAIQAPRIPVINNIDVAVQTTPEGIRDALYRQAFGPVRWVEVTQALACTRPEPHLRVRPRQGAVRPGQACGRGDRFDDRPRSRQPGAGQGATGMSEASAAPQVALVTGASRGIGRAIALALAAAGLRVVGTATTAAGAAGITDALASSGGQGWCWT
jgi:acyl transferase domain-containing protein